MKIIVDTSAIIAVIANENLKKNVVSTTKNAELYAPASLNWEMGNAISAMFKRKAVDKATGLQLLKAYQTIRIAVIDIDIIRAVDIAHTYKIYAYDAYMLQCAIEQKAPLLTLDKGLQAIARLIDITLLEI